MPVRENKKPQLILSTCVTSTFWFFNCYSVGYMSVLHGRTCSERLLPAEGQVASCSPNVESSEAFVEYCWILRKCCFCTKYWFSFCFIFDFKFRIYDWAFLYWCLQCIVVRGGVCRTKLNEWNQILHFSIFFVPSPVTFVTQSIFISRPECTRPRWFKNVIDVVSLV